MTTVVRYSVLTASFATVWTVKVQNMKVFIFCFFLYAILVTIFVPHKNYIIVFCFCFRSFFLCMIFAPMTITSSYKLLEWIRHKDLCLLPSSSFFNKSCPFSCHYCTILKEEYLSEIILSQMLAEEKISFYTNVLLFHAKVGERDVVLKRTILPWSEYGLKGFPRHTEQDARDKRWWIQHSLMPQFCHQCRSKLHVTGGKGCICHPGLLQARSSEGFPRNVWQAWTNEGFTKRCVWAHHTYFLVVLQNN